MALPVRPADVRTVQTPPRRFRESRSGRKGIPKAATLVRSVPTHTCRRLQELDQLISRLCPKSANPESPCQFGQPEFSRRCAHDVRRQTKPLDIGDKYPRARFARDDLTPVRDQRCWLLTQRPQSAGAVGRPSGLALPANRRPHALLDLAAGSLESMGARHTLGEMGKRDRAEPIDDLETQGAELSQVGLVVELASKLPPRCIAGGRIGISIGVGRVYDPITDRASTDWWAAACPPTRTCAARAVGTAVTVGGAIPAGPHPSRRWDRRPRRRSPRGGGALGPYSGDRRSVGERAWGACRAPARGGPCRWGAPWPGVRLT